MNEAERVKAYLDTIDRMEPEITMVDRDAALASIAISLRRIADALNEPNDHAHVIVAAPDMLAALEEAVDEWDYQSSEAEARGLVFNDPPWVAPARAAIAKARGRTK